MYLRVLLGQSASPDHLGRLHFYTEEELKEYKQEQKRKLEELVADPRYQSVMDPSAWRKNRLPAPHSLTLKYNWSRKQLSVSINYTSAVRFYAGM
jgi:hypothetical protein